VPRPWDFPEKPELEEEAVPTSPHVDNSIPAPVDAPQISSIAQAPTVSDVTAK
jgi:hypothetical protein